MLHKILEDKKYLPTEYLTKIICAKTPFSFASSEKSSKWKYNWFCLNIYHKTFISYYTKVFVFVDTWIHWVNINV